MDKTLKQRVKTLLLQREYDELLRLCQEDKRFWNILRLYLYDTDENLRRPAIETVAMLMKKWWHEGSQDRVIEYIRNLLWLLNDESGGTGWSAPEIIAETIIAIPELLEPYGSIMIGYSLEKGPLLDSGLWATGRLGQQGNRAVASFQDKVLAVFDSQHPDTLGLAAWALGEAKFTPAVAFLELLRDRKEPVRIYVDGHFQEKTLGEWSEEAIAKISH